MSWRQRENELKLDILESLAKSQRALARMIEAMADVSGDVSGFSAALRGNISILSRYQKVLAEKIVGIRVADVQRGRPGKIWLHPKLLKPFK